MCTGINILHMFVNVQHNIKREVEGIRKTQNELLEMKKIQWLKLARDYTLKKNLVT